LMNCRIVDPAQLDHRQEERHLVFILNSANSDSIPPELYNKMTIGEYNPHKFIFYGESLPLKYPRIYRPFVVAELLPTDPPHVYGQTVNNAFHMLRTEEGYQQSYQQLRLKTRLLQQLIEIGIALSGERDSQELLQRILKSSRDITFSDAGSLYLLEESEQGKRLRFIAAQNDSVKTDFSEFTLPLNKKSMAGYVAVTGKPLNIANVYDMPRELGLTHNSSFDEMYGYKTRSMLVLPMRNLEGKILGVIQLINRKPEQAIILHSADQIDQNVLAYDNDMQTIAEALASQAAISLENTQLADNIKKLFAGLIKGAVKTIESRDPSTRGHSERVTRLTLALARAVNECDSGPYAGTVFNERQLRELEVAGLLHDFGKVLVREQTLVKANKLFDHELEAIRMRFKQAALVLQIKRLQGKNESTRATDVETAELQQLLEAIEQANRPTVLEEDVSQTLEEIRKKTFSLENEKISLLNDREAQLLSIKRGSLSPQERLEIESHVTHSYNFLKYIPWTEDLKKVPEIAYCHHEKIDGSGYPRRLQGGQIPLQARIMTIADIFDALTASDRPYKKAMPVEKALSILEQESERGQLDSTLFRLFRDKEIYQHVNWNKEKDEYL